MPLSPKHKASAVTALGATARNGRPRRSLGRLSLTISCQSLGDAGRRLSADAAEHRLAGDAALAEHDLARRVIGQIDVDAAAEPDEADPLPRRDDVAGLGEGDAAARDQPRDLGSAAAAAVVRLDAEMLAVVLVARLVDLRREALRSARKSVGKGMSWSV